MGALTENWFSMSYFQVLTKVDEKHTLAIPTAVQ